MNTIFYMLKLYLKIDMKRISDRYKFEILREVGCSLYKLEYVIILSFFL